MSASKTSEIEKPAASFLPNVHMVFSPRHHRAGALRRATDNQPARGDCAAGLGAADAQGLGGDGPPARKLPERAGPFQERDVDALFGEPVRGRFDERVGGVERGEQLEGALGQTGWRVMKSRGF